VGKIQDRAPVSKFDRDGPWHEHLHIPRKLLGGRIVDFKAILAVIHVVSAAIYGATRLGQ
jgi:hypothetical protein